MNKNKRTIMKQFLVGLLMVFTTMTGYSQITGTVIDEEANQPLPGATVVVKLCAGHGWQGEPPVFNLQH